MKRLTALCTLLLVTLTAAACSDSSDPVAGDDAGPGSSTSSSSSGGIDFSSGTELLVPVVPGQRSHVNLSTLAVVEPTDPADDKTWDLAFEGYDVFTNSGVSGTGGGGAFGPLEDVYFVTDQKPSEIPFMFTDKNGGAFVDWYFYEGTPNHLLWSRYHVIGIKDGDRHFKVQVLGYYGQRDGAAVAALYKVRYAEVTAAGSGEVKVLDLFDGTAGGTAAPETAPSECVDLGTGVRVMHTPAAAAEADDWHICVRRDALQVNGGTSGKRGVLGVDLDAAQTASETLDAIKARTESSERARFDAVDHATLAAASHAADGVVSAFRRLWLSTSASPPTSGAGVWVVQGASSKQSFLVAFPEFRGSTADGPGTIVMRVKNLGE